MHHNFSLVIAVIYGYKEGYGQPLIGNFICIFMVWIVTDINGYDTYVARHLRMETSAMASETTPFCQSTLIKVPHTDACG